jgi:transcriptional regulator with XRE-family HTH domain
VTQANVYKQIKELRENAGYTQHYIAERLGVDNATYSRIESGKIDITVSRFIQLADILHVSPGSLLADTVNSVLNAVPLEADTEEGYIADQAKK